MKVSSTEKIALEVTRMNGKNIIKKTYLDLIEDKAKNKYFAEKYEQCKLGFYFSEGLERLKYLEKKYTDVESLKKALATLKQKNDKKNDAYDIFKKNHKELSDSINGFVAYCDVNAKSTNDDGKSYYSEKEGKRCIAKAFIRQNAWVMNIIQYLINLKEKEEKDMYENVAYGVKRALMYFKKPNEQFNILSERHIKSIAEYYGVEMYNSKNEFCFDEELRMLFEESIKEELEKENISEENYTSIYSNIIYEHRKEWEIMVDTSLLEANKNVILTGAPGTGKTYLAKQMAAKMIGCNLEKLENNDQFGFVQFHPSYDYTDFVEGLRPKQIGDTVGFELYDGIFKKFCKKAFENAFEKQSENYVFIIDEINRGEISKILGELFFSIDPGYRGTSGTIKTQYANMQAGEDFAGKFFVPENVYIIGTMNDIDRSVESMDFAFRRRFAFEEIKAEDTAENILYGLSDDCDMAYKKMQAINDTLTNMGLTDCYHIGASYFLKVELYKNKSKNKWKCLWNYHLKGTLYEYFRGEPDAEEKIKLLKDAYDSGIPKK